MDQEQPTIPPPTNDNTPFQTNQAPPLQPADAVVPAKTKSKKILVILIIAWLLAFPAAISLSIVNRVIVRDDTTTSETSEASLSSGGIAPLSAPAVEIDKPSPVSSVLNILTLLLGLYGVVGWIPVLIVAVKKK